MKKVWLQVVSDLHLEWYEDDGRELLVSGIRWDDEVDALVLAGDIGSVGVRAGTLETAFEFFSSRFPRTFYVPGNHEFYRSEAEPALAEIRALAARFPSVTFLEPGVIGEVHGRRVLGATLWFAEARGVKRLERFLSDFSLVGGFKPWVYRQNRAHVEWFERELRKNDIVVTHHIPSPLGIGRRYAKDLLNAFFLCDLETLIEERKPALWAHGHTHDSAAYQVGGTRMICNPLGYPSDPNPAFSKVLVRV